MIGEIFWIEFEFVLFALDVKVEESLGPLYIHRVFEIVDLFLSVLIVVVFRLLTIVTCYRFT